MKINLISFYIFAAGFLALWSTNAYAFSCTMDEYSALEQKQFENQAVCKRGYKSGCKKLETTISSLTAFNAQCPNKISVALPSNPIEIADLPQIGTKLCKRAKAAKKEAQRLGQRILFHGSIANQNKMVIEYINPDPKQGSVYMFPSAIGYNPFLNKFEFVNLRDGRFWRVKLLTNSAQKMAFYAIQNNLPTAAYYDGGIFLIYIVDPNTKKAIKAIALYPNDSEVTGSYNSVINYIITRSRLTTLMLSNILTQTHNAAMNIISNFPGSGWTYDY